MKVRVFIVVFFISGLSFAQVSTATITSTNNQAIDVSPEMIGGKEEWKRIFHDHLFYPQPDLVKKTEGSVQLIFTVGEDGKVVNLKVSSILDSDMEKEAVRLFKMIEWMPAKKDGKALAQEYSMEINFSPSKYKRWVKERKYDKPAFNEKEVDTSFVVYESAEKAPAFYDTEKTFSEFIFSNIDYPEMAKKQGLEGYVVMSFIIETDGHVSNIRIKSGVGGGCNEEAIRVIGLTTWTPAIKNGKYVRFRMYYTMSFSLKNSFKDNSSGSQRSWGQ